MQNFVRILVAAIFAVFLSVAVSAQVTEFNYQGGLKDGGNPANGTYDFELALFDAPAGGNQVGVTLSRPGVSVAGGIFSVQLDFGNQFPGANRYLEVRVRLAGQPALTPLLPRQLVNSTPTR